MFINPRSNCRCREHRQVSLAVKAAIVALGCTQVPESREAAANTMTCVRFPAEVKGPAFLKHVVECGVSLSGGLHKQIKTEYFRIGHMGPSTRRLDHVVKTIKAIESALAACGHQFKRGAGLEKIYELKKNLPSIKSCPSLCTFQVIYVCILVVLV